MNPQGQPLSQEEVAQRIGGMVDAILARHGLSKREAFRAIQAALELFADSDGEILLMDEAELEAEIVHQWNVLQVKF